MRRIMLILVAATVGLTALPPEAVIAMEGKHNATRLKPLAGKDTAEVRAADITNPGLYTGQSSASTETLPPSTSKTRIGEELDKRTAHSNVYINSDGSRTLEFSPSTPINYQTAAGWQKIEQKKQKDNLYQPTKLLEDGMLPEFFEPAKANAVDVSAGRLSAKLKPFTEGIELTIGGKILTVVPHEAKNVRPELVDTGGSSYVIYRNVWDGVDVVYETVGESLKETIILTKPGTRNDFMFTVQGATLAAHPQIPGALAIDGLDPAEYGISPLNIIVQGKGLIDETVGTQEALDDKVKISVDRQWLDAQPAQHFPIAVDPSFQTGITNGFTSHKSNGFSCADNACAGLNTGAVAENGWKYWRSMMRVPYEVLQGKTLKGAALHLQMASRPYYTGTPFPQTVYASWAHCLGFNCLGGTLSSMSLAESGWMDVTPTLRWLMDNNIWDGWLGIRGDEGDWLSYKLLEPDATVLFIDYTSAPPMAQPASPGADAVVATTQPMLYAAPVSDPDGDQVQYLFRVTSSAGGGGAAAQSGWSTSNQWTVPEGVLEDGATYYWQVYTSDGYATTAPNWTRAVKVDMRTGKDTTQSYDTVGALHINMATGNLTTANGSHSEAALGGSIGIGLEYNSPQQSRPGLVGEYWNAAEGQTPSGPARMTRVDANIDFNWAHGSPETGVINNDWYHAKWTGYLTVPTSGHYQFGGSNDDVFRIKINNQEVYNTACYTGLCYGNAIYLEAGQVVPIEAYFVEATQAAYARMFVKGAVAEQVVPSAWLHTGVRPVGVAHGLTGRYYHDSGNHQIPANENEAFLSRVDSTMSFDWGHGSVIGGAPTDAFMARWSGYFIAPQTGSYQFGTTADDGVRIKVNNQQVYDYWTCCSNEGFGSAVQLTAGQLVPISVDYFEANGPAYFRLLVQGAVPKQIVPSAWLVSAIPSLPVGWKLTADPDGNLSYDSLRAGSDSVVLTDTGGETHEYKWQNGGYRPPASETGYLVRNQDGTFTLQDSDGRTYVFNADGSLQSSVTPLDDRKPAALRYEYGGSPSRLTKIIDGVTPDRFMTLHYAGDAACTAPPAGFDAPLGGMLCAAKTQDGTTTKFWYKNGRLSRIERPGGEVNDYAYDTLGRITSFRSSLAADAIAAGQRADDATATTEVTYDAVGRVSGVTQPAPTPGANRLTHTYQYLAGATNKHVVGATEPHGFSQRVEYDATFRTTKLTDIANLSVTTEWWGSKDLVTTSTDATGLKTSTIYDLNERPWQKYGPAPAAWYGANNAPLPAYAAQVPRSDTLYDQNIVGPAVSYYHYRSSSLAPQGGSLIGAPKQFATGYNATNPGNLDAAWGADPLAAESGASGWGMVQTGVINMQTSGTYSIAIHHTEGARLYLNDQLVINNWSDGPYRSSAIHTFNYTAGQTSIRWRLDFYSKYGTPNPALRIYVNKQGGFDWTNNWTPFLSPNYGLTTTSIAYDAALGNVESKINYGNRPELGLVHAATLDPTGLNYSNTNGFEAPGAGFLRQTSRALPGGTATTYSHYGATETADNPCTAQTDPTHQGGRIKTRTEPDPGGSGSQTPRTTQTVYDTLGRTVASRYNEDPWTCTSYDARGRVATTMVPSILGKPARTITNTWAVGGNPFVTSSADSSGTINATVDLLGRTTSYTDVHSNTTTTSYDSLGRVSQRQGPLGTEVFVYDNFDRLTEQKLDGTTIAKPYYDAYSRLSSVDYPTAGTQKLNSITRDNLGRTTGMTWLLGNNSTVSDSVTRTQSGLIASGTENGIAKTYNYDKANRLTAATIGADTYSYSFAAPTACTGTYNANAHKNSNHTAKTVNGVTTTYCYDHADRLVSSNDATVTAAQYDAHGNTTQLGTSPVTQFGYDSSDRNVSVTEGTKSLAYERDVQNRITKRTYTDTANTSTNNEVRYGFSGGSDTPDLLLNTSNQVVEKYLQLTGGALLTVRPNEPVANNQSMFSLPNIHGDIMTTTNAAGTKLADFAYDPFGNVVSAGIPTNTATGTTFGWVGQHEKLTESQFTLKPTQMGTRVYLPSLGRFAQVDPVEGGVENAYVYPLNPVTMFDLDGNASFGEFFGWWGDRAKEFAVGVYNVPIIGPRDLIVQPVQQVFAPKSSFGERAMGALALTPIGKGGKIGKSLMDNELFGVNSKLFGNYTLKNHAGLNTGEAGLLNKRSSQFRVGWSVRPSKSNPDTLSPVFRVSLGGKHIDLIFGRFFK